MSVLDKYKLKISDVKNGAKDTIKKSSGGSTTTNTTDWSGIGAKATNSVITSLGKQAGNGTTVPGNVLTSLGSVLPGWYGAIAAALGTAANFAFGVNDQPYQLLKSTLRNLWFGGDADSVTQLLASMPTNYSLRKSNYGFLQGSKRDLHLRKLAQDTFDMNRRGEWAADNVGAIGTFNQARDIAAYGGPIGCRRDFGGPLFGYSLADPGTAIGYQLATDQQALQRQKYNNKFTAPMFSLGGGFSTDGSDFTNGLIHVDAGGVHETNPYEGVPMGTDGLGSQNLVEEGETVYRSNVLGEGGYVFSERLTVPEYKPKDYDLFEVLPYEAKVLKKYGGKTFAAASKLIEKDSYGIKGKGSNAAGNGAEDEISKNMYVKMMEILKSLLELVREEERMKQMQEAIAQMSPELRDLMALLMMALAQLQQALEQAMQQLAMLELAMQEQGIPQEAPEELVDYRDPRSNPLTDGRLQLAVPEEAVEALGGYLYGDGGEKSVRKRLAKGWYDNTIGAISNLFASGAQQGVFGGGSMAGAGAGGTWYPVSTQPPNNKRFEGIPVPYRSFNDAYAEARRQGKETFEFNGKTYSTAYDNSNDPERAKAHKKAGDNRQEWTVIGRWRDKKADGGHLFSKGGGTEYAWDILAGDINMNRYKLDKTAKEYEDSYRYQRFTDTVYDILKEYAGKPVEDIPKEIGNILYYLDALDTYAKDRGGTSGLYTKKGDLYLISDDAAEIFKRRRTDGKLGVYHYTPEANFSEAEIQAQTPRISTSLLDPSSPVEIVRAGTSNSLNTSSLSENRGLTELSTSTTEDKEKLKEAEKKVGRYYRKHNINPKDVNQDLFLRDVQQYLQTGNLEDLSINTYSKNLRSRTRDNRTLELNGLPQVKHYDLISRLNPVQLDDNGNFVLTDSRGLTRADGVRLKDNKTFVDSTGLGLTPGLADYLYSNPIAGLVLRDENGEYRDKFFTSLDDLTKYYRQMIWPFFDDMKGFNPKGPKPTDPNAADYLDRMHDYYIHGHLNKDNVAKFLEYLRDASKWGDDAEKNAHLADIIEKNIDLNNSATLPNPNQVWETQQYREAVKKANEKAALAGLPLPFDEARATDHWWGEDHPPLLEAYAASQELGSETRRVLMGLNGEGALDPSIVYRNYNWETNPLGIDYTTPTYTIPADKTSDDPYDVQIYGVAPLSVENNFIKIGDQWYSIPEEAKGQFKANSNPSETLSVTAPDTVLHSENYYTLNDAEDGGNDPQIPATAVWPAVLNGSLGILGGIAGMLMNRERPVKGISAPIIKSKNPHSPEVLPDYVDRNYAANRLIAQGNAANRMLSNLSAGNSGRAMAGIMANNANTLGAVGDANYKGWVQNEEERLKVALMNINRELEELKMNQQADLAYNDNLIKLAGLNANYIDAQDKLNFQRNLEALKSISGMLNNVGLAANNFAERDYRNKHDYWYFRSGADGNFTRYLRDLYRRNRGER